MSILQPLYFSVLDICNIQSKYDLHIMLIVDSNSRTGTLIDIIVLGNNNDVLDKSDMNYVS